MARSEDTRLEHHAKLALKQVVSVSFLHILVAVSIHERIWNLPDFVNFFPVDEYGLPVKFEFEWDELLVLQGLLELLRWTLLLTILQGLESLGLLVANALMAIAYPGAPPVTSRWYFWIKALVAAVRVHVGCEETFGDLPLLMSVAAFYRPAFTCDDL